PVNYAMPGGDAHPTATEVAALLAAYERRDRLPRLECLPAVAPAVKSALLAGGFVVERETPLMTCARSAVQALPAPAGIELVGPRSDAELLATATVQHVAYDDPETPGQAEVDALKATLEAGGLIVLARDTATGEAAGGGIATPPP